MIFMSVDKTGRGHVIGYAIITGERAACIGPAIGLLLDAAKTVIGFDPAAPTVPEGTGPRASHPSHQSD